MGNSNTQTRRIGVPIQEVFLRVNDINKAGAQTHTLILGGIDLNKRLVDMAFSDRVNGVRVNPVHFFDLSEKQIQVPLTRYCKAANISGLLIVENLDLGSDAFQKCLLSIIQGGRVKISMGRSEPIRFRLLVTTSSDAHITADLLSKFETIIRLPSVEKEGQEAVFIVEYLNWKLSKQLNMPWAPLTKSMADRLKDFANEPEKLKAIEEAIWLMLKRRKDILDGKFNPKDSQDIKQQAYFDRYWTDNFVTRADFALAFLTVGKETPDTPLSELYKAISRETVESAASGTTDQQREAYFV